jgi:hypothetical protein
MKVECERFKVKEGKSAVVDKWMAFLNENMEDVLLTLENEKMYIETIFREKNDKGEFLYWYSVQGENGVSVEESNHWIDKKHIEYWNECIDFSYASVELEPVVQMIEKDVQAIMDEKEKK